MNFQNAAALVHALGGEEEFHAIGQAVLEGGAQAFHAGLGALGAAGDVVAEEIRIAQPDHLVAAEHRDGLQRLDDGRADFERGVRVIRDAVDGFVGETVIHAAGELVVEFEGLFADHAVITADHREEVSGVFLEGGVCFRGHGRVLTGRRRRLQARGRKERNCEGRIGSQKKFGGSESADDQNPKFSKPRGPNRSLQLVCSVVLYVPSSSNHRG